MATNNEIHEFAKRWFELCTSPNPDEYKFRKCFSDQCFALGFEMDLGERFEATFPGTDAFNNYEALEKIIGQIQDVQLLGSAIFSKWRVITHWYEESLFEPEHKIWFILAFRHLAELTSEEGENPVYFTGQVQKIQISSNVFSFGFNFELNKEVAQLLTINADGQVEFIGYNYSNKAPPDARRRTNNFSIGKEAATRILGSVATYFSQPYFFTHALDIGNWSMDITNTEGKSYHFHGSHNGDFRVHGVDLSDLIRDTLDMPDLFVFDGNYDFDRVDKISIDYHRVTTIRPGKPVSGFAESCRWDYSETIVIDRVSDTLEHTQHIGSECVITRKYYVKDGIASFLDDIIVDDLFEHIVGNSSDTVTDPHESKDYKIIVDFKKRPQLVIEGTFDKNGLPSDFPGLAEDILNLMLFYGIGEILNPAIYTKAKRKVNDHIFCSVAFNENGKSYYYITKDDKLKVGDDVIVPVGNEGNTAIVRIIDIEYSSEDQVPFPLEKVKHIIGKANENN